MSHHPTSANIWFSLDDGHLVNLDPRENKPMYYDVGEGKKIACIHVNPTQPDYIACSGLNYAIDVFDARKMKGSSTSEANAAVGDAVWHEDTGRAVSGCYWNPLGTQLATTSHDNTVRLWSHLTDSEAVDSHVIQHNNFTGKLSFSYANGFMKSSFIGLINSHSLRSLDHCFPSPLVSARFCSHYWQHETRYRCVFCSYRQSDFSQVRP